jgi:Fe-S-cluster-containing dehydrogenase component/CRP-like cAMP-binding protein
MERSQTMPDDDAKVFNPRIQRWSVPFSPEMSDADVAELLKHPELKEISPEQFSRDIPLAGIYKNDAAIRRLKSGDIVVRAGDYGNSAFIVLEGSLCEFSAQDLSGAVLGRLPKRRKTLLETFAQVWQQGRFPEVRNFDQQAERSMGGTSFDELGRLPNIQDLRQKYNPTTLEAGSLFGVIAALGRMPHEATFAALSDCRLLEIRWQGVKEIRNFCESWRKQFDEKFRRNALATNLKAHPLFKTLNDEGLNQVKGNTLFESYGDYDWHASYKELRRQQKNVAQVEPIIARQGDYADGVIIIRAGFARLTIQAGSGERTVTYLGPNDYFGLDELYESWRNNSKPSLTHTLRGLGYIDILRIPTSVLQTWVFPDMKPPKKPQAETVKGPLSVDDAMMEWLVGERLINGTKAMLIDLNKCVRCDDCVRACGSTHGGNPRFVRHGYVHENWMVTNACMHCVDPVCLIGCPTGAIHRSEAGGTVLINDDTCIGCKTCADSCPYDNIVMVAINDQLGRLRVDPEDKKPLLKATKCDLCSSEIAGPACVRACPYDALRRVDFRDLSVLEK